MPCSCPSFQWKLMAYLPTGLTSVGRAAALNIGRAPATGLIGSPACRPSFSRSSLHRAQGQASRRNGKLYTLRWPSFHSMSTPVPVVTLTLTDLGSATRSIKLPPLVSHAKKPGEELADSHSTRFPPPGFSHHLRRLRRYYTFRRYCLPLDGTHRRSSSS